MTIFQDQGCLPGQATTPMLVKNWGERELLQNNSNT